MGRLEEEKTLTSLQTQLKLFYLIVHVPIKKTAAALKVGVLHICSSREMFCKEATFVITNSVLFH